MTSLRIIAAAIGLTAAGTATGAAGEDAGSGIVSEVKVGIFQHDIDFLPESVEDGQAVNAEILFMSPFPRGETWSFRPHLGTTVALEGETDQIYAGLTLTVHPFDEGALAPLWLSAFGGGAVHDGDLDTGDTQDKSLGSRALFRYGFELGYDVTDRANVSAYYAHISSANLAMPNPGLEHAGVRVGWRF